MKLQFYTPSFGVGENFGAATFGFAGAECEKDTLSKLFDKEIEGEVVCGSYEHCLDNIPEGDYCAAIVLMGNAGGENEFIRTLSQKLSVPLVGGSGAIDPVTGKSGLIFGEGQAAVFLINDKNYDILVECENIHYDVLSKHELSLSDARTIDKIDGQDAYSWYSEKRKELGLEESDFEHLTFADSFGINAHLSVVDGKVKAGRDLESEMYLRYVSPEDTQKRIENFYNDSDAVIFGCAGLKQTLHTGLKTEGLGLFMFGEVCTVQNYSDFGNLMLSKIVFKKLD